MSNLLSTRTPRVTLVTNMLPPYRVGFYNEIARRVDLTVVLDTLSEFNRAWQTGTEDCRFKMVTQNCRSFIYKRHRHDVHYTERRQFHFSELTYRALRESRPEAIITAEFGFRTMWSLLYGAIHRVPVTVYSEGTLHTEGHVGFIKRMIRRAIVSQATRFWTNGPESTRLLESYGADPARVDEGMTGIDTTEWCAGVEEWRSRRDAVRAELGLVGRVFLFSGSLSPRKGILQMAAAAARVAAEPDCPTFSLLILGDGENREWLEDWIKRNPGIKVVTTGFVQHPELPRYFAAADWAILPTLDDNWPLATLETLVAGLPQLFSIYNGATADLCHSDTGVEFDPLDERSFQSALSGAVRSSLERVPQERIREVSEYYSASSQGGRAAVSVRAAIRD
jgi:glycosyltransferase involved in cell wall biosynthesis